MEARKRTGVIAKKVGMSRIFLQSEDSAEAGRHIPVTLLQVESCQVLAVRTAGQNGYSAVQLGAGPRKPKNVSKPMRGHFAKAKVEPKTKVVEFRVQEDVDLPLGAEITADHFVPGQFVDVRGVTQGKGFAGVIKRHNFRSQRASHGALKVHRQAGSTGQCQDPGRVFKGKKMAGQMGNVWKTQQNLQVVEIDMENGLIVIKGALPGSKGSYVLVQDALKKALPEAAPFPAGLKGSAKPQAAEQQQPEVMEAPAEVAVEAPAADGENKES